MSYFDVQQLNQKLIHAILNAPSPIRLHSGGPVSSSTGIRSSGMDGFSEKGQPSTWDMGIGYVTGYRWWKLAVPAELAGYKSYSLDTDSYGNTYSTYTSPWSDGMREDALMGANSQYWADGRQEAVCTRGDSCPSWSALLAGMLPMDHEPPEYRESCGCGFWAYFSPHLDVAHVLGGMSGDNPSRSGQQVILPIIGVVKGTGRVIIGEKGFRSQYAEIMGLALSDRARMHLNWNITPDDGSERDRMTRAVQQSSSLWGVITGRTQGMTWYSDTHSRRNRNEVVRSASDPERLMRYSAVEAILSSAYPSARVFSSESTLKRYFPPDPNYYDPNKREQPPFW